MVTTRDMELGTSQVYTYHTWQTCQLLLSEAAGKQEAGLQFGQHAELYSTSQKWLTKYMLCRFATISSGGLATLAEGDIESGHDSDKELHAILALARFMVTCLQQSPKASIDAILKQWYQRDESPATSAVTEQLNSERRLQLFRILSRLTMLYTPQSGTTSALAIKAHGSNCSNDFLPLQYMGRSTSDLLRGFGLSLPKAWKVPPTLSSPGLPNLLLVRDFNVESLHKAKGIRIEWTTCVAAHLRFSEKTKTLSLFCAPSYFSISYGSDSLLHKLLRDFQATETQFVSSKVNAYAASDLLHEIALSFQFLFRDSKRGRKNYRSNQRDLLKVAFGNDGIDPLLDFLCGFTEFRRGSAATPIRDTYSKENDFPIFSARLSELQAFTAHEKPRRFRALWSDRSDINMWYTFWAVLVFGSIGVLIGILQLIFQVMQTVYTIKAT